jgi:hypothetical protein
MTTDEKLDRLTERTEALAQSVELLASLHRDYEAKAEERAARTDRNVDRIVGIVENLVNLVFNHEGRLRTLEG